MPRGRMPREDGATARSYQPGNAGLPKDRQKPREGRKGPPPEAARPWSWTSSLRDSETIHLYRVRPPGEWQLAPAAFPAWLGPALWGARLHTQGPPAPVGHRWGRQAWAGSRAGPRSSSGPLGRVPRPHLAQRESDCDVGSGRWGAGRSHALGSEPPSIPYLPLVGEPRGGRLWSLPRGLVTGVTGAGGRSAHAPPSCPPVLPLTCLPTVCPCPPAAWKIHFGGPGQGPGRGGDGQTQQRSSVCLPRPALTAACLPVPGWGPSSCSGPLIGARTARPGLGLQGETES